MGVGVHGGRDGYAFEGNMLDEALEVLAKAWSGQPFSFNGNRYKVKGDLPGSAAQFLPTPIQKHIPICVG
ncbi:MAG: hypothetical protein MUO26_07835 [Methanotrichaceae archaeon]|nr:hypothetical protein [Methanotrichaceae archaeon]